MSADDREAEDVSSLFRKFGGDASGYKEFEALEDNSATGTGWALVPGKGPAAAQRAEASPAQQAEAPIAPSPSPSRSPSAFAAQAAPPAFTPQAQPPSFVTPTAQHSATISAPAADAGAPRELDLLFARLAGQDSGIDPGHRLLSRWRRPS